MFVRTETAEACSRKFDAVRQRAQQFYSISEDVAYASVDHSEAIASAFVHQRPCLKLLNCWPLLLCQARKTREDLVAKPQPVRFDDDYM
jgi:hypothetical protein